jgi:hypothetical protein
MNLVIKCLGFAVYTDSKGWKQIQELETSLEFIEGLINTSRPVLAFDTFRRAFKRRNQSIEYVRMLKRVHGRKDWIPKKVSPCYYW